MTVKDFYDENSAYEWNRLERHRTEFAVTLRALDDYLPGLPAEILDIGGGPGRYSIALAQRGYSVTLLDLSPGNLALAKEKALEAGVEITRFVQGNALDLGGYQADTFDVVLLMGPLYHLLKPNERKQAATDAKRVLKPDGMIFATFVTRFAPFRDVAANNPGWLFQDLEYGKRLLATGVHDRVEGRVTQMYFAHPDEVKPLMESAGFVTKQVLAVEGVVSGHEEKINQLEGRAWEAWVDLNYQFSYERSLFGAADHLLYIGNKPNE